MHVVRTAQLQSDRCAAAVTGRFHADRDLNIFHLPKGTCSENEDCTLAIDLGYAYTGKRDGPTDSQGAT
jgi:hypothetical protein